MSNFSSWLNIIPSVPFFQGSNLLLEEMTDELKANFPNLQFLVNDKDKQITIPAKSVEVGSITIYDDSHELTIGVGNFTHWHASCYEDSLNEKEKQN